MDEFINRIINEDCAKGMAKMPDGSVDLTVTSPPYDNLRDYGGYELDIDEIISQLYRVTKEGGVVVWVVGDATSKGSESGSSFRQALKFMDCGFNLHDTMIYKKDSISFPDTVRYYQIFEYMFVFSKGKPKSINLLRDRPNKSYNGTKRIRGRNRQKDGSLKGNRKGNLLKPFGVRYNIWEYAVGQYKSTKDIEASDHPAIFPESLAEDHIQSWSCEGDLVFDPFMGSGTTAKMAKLNGRDFLGFEVYPEYIDIAKIRLSRIEDKREVGE